MNTIMVQRLRLSSLSQDEAERRRLKQMWSESCQSKAQYELVVESRVAQSDVTHNLLIITNNRELSAGSSKAIFPVSILTIEMQYFLISFPSKLNSSVKVGQLELPVCLWAAERVFSMTALPSSQALKLSWRECKAGDR